MISESSTLVRIYPTPTLPGYWPTWVPTSSRLNCRAAGILFAPGDLSRRVGRAIRRPGAFARFVGLDLQHAAAAEFGGGSSEGGGG